MGRDSLEQSTEDTLSIGPATGSYSGSHRSSTNFLATAGSTLLVNTLLLVVLTDGVDPAVPTRLVLLRCLPE